MFVQSPVYTSLSILAYTSVHKDGEGAQTAALTSLPTLNQESSWRSLRRRVTTGDQRSYELIPDLTSQISNNNLYSQELGPK